MNKKAIGPVIASALLLVVAVIAVIGFQTWWGDYSSTILTNAELKNSNDSISKSKIHDLIGRSLYFENSVDNLTILSVKVDDLECNNAIGNYSYGMKELDLSDCMFDLESKSTKVSIITNKGILNKDIYLTDFTPIIHSDWTNIFDSTNTDRAYGLTIDKLGNSYITGQKYLLSGNSQSNTIKYNNDGEMVWDVSHSLSSSQLYTNTIMVDGNYDVYIAGKRGQAFLAKLNGSNGSVLWYTETDLGYFSEEISNILFDSENNIYVTGNMHAGDFNYHLLLMKLNSTGDHIWNTSLNNLSGVDIKLDSSNNIYVSGTKKVSTFDFDIFVYKFNSSGSPIWNYTPNLSSFGDYAGDLVLDDQGNIFVISTFNNGVNSNDLFIFKLNSSGSIIWNDTYDHNNGFEFGSGIDRDRYNNIYVTGRSNNDIIIFKYNTIGSRVWNSTYDGGNTDSPSELSVLSSGKAVYVTGISSNGVNDDYVTLKRSIN